MANRYEPTGKTCLITGGAKTGSDAGLRLAPCPYEASSARVILVVLRIGSSGRNWANA